MGDEIDAFNLPLHESQSGNMDAGHMSELGQNLRQEQAGELNTALETYYTGSHDYHRLRENLEDLGYSEQRIENIAQSAFQEAQFRDANNGEPSDLTPNQLVFIQNQHDPGGRNLALNLNYRHIHTLPNGRQYIDDLRVRNVDGTPSRLYLPRPIPFDPLTGEQQAEVDIIQSAGRDVFITEDADTGETIDLTDNQREEVMYLATNYLNSDPDFREAQRLQFRNNVQQIQGLSSIDNIQEKLLELFVDIEDEYNYRQNNNGVPRGIDSRQYDYLRHQSGTYRGQPILIEPESGISYYYSERGKTPIPTGTQIEQMVGVGQIDYLTLDIRPTNEDYNNLNEILTDYLIGNTDETQTLTNIEALAQYRPNDPVADPFRSDMYSEYFRTFQVSQREKEFRDLNNGRPSQISELQYEYLLNHALVDEREERYRGQPIFTHSDGHLTYRMRNGINLEIPSDEYIEGFIEQGLYTRPADIPERNPQLDDETIPDYRIQRIITAIGQDRFNNLSPEQIEILRGVVNRKGDLVTTYDTFNIDYVEPQQQIIFTEQERIERLPPIVPRDPAQAPGLIPEAPPGFEPPIIPGQQTQPINLRTGEDIPVDTPESNVLRYQRYFNDNQSLYVNFRNTFRSILPVLSGITSSYIAYSYVSVRNKNTLRNIINDEYDLIRQLESRIERANQELSSLESSGVYQQYQERGFLTTQQENLIEKYTSLTPGIDPKQIGEASVIRRSIENIESRLSEINTNLESLEKLTDRLNRDVDNSQVYTTLINNQLEEIINTDYTVLENLKQYAPTILSGFSVGYTLGLVLSGYLFPTYMSINEPYITADNIEYDKRDKKTTDIKSQFEKDDFSEPPNHVPATIKQDDYINKSRIVIPYKETFRPIKHGKRPLKYEEIQELKATLNQSELNNLKNKFLYFDEGKLQMEKTTDKCKNVIQETQITKRKLF